MTLRNLQSAMCKILAEEDCALNNGHYMNELFNDGLELRRTKLWVQQLRYFRKDI